MTPREASNLVECGDLYGLLLKVGRAWIEKDHPDATHATLVVPAGEDLPDNVVVITPHPSSLQPVPA